jgi:type I restriction enzyme S subunit
MATAEWKPAKLDELGFVGRGKSRHRPRNAAFLYGGRYPFFQTGDIKAANFHLTEYSQTYSEEGLAQSKLWKPGTLCITIAANIAESAILGIEGCFPDSVVGFIADPDKADVRFIKYYMEILKLQMQSVSRGTTQDNLSVDKLLSFDFLVPPLPLQRRIAGILSAYDELIENSQRRIRILEAMARALYREWFVHFRFPGHDNSAGVPDWTAEGRPEGVSATDGAHQKLPRVASPLGDIPQGWEGRFGDLATIERDGINPFEFPDEEFEHFSIPAFDNGRQPAIELGATILSGKYCIDDSTVLLSKLNPRIPRIWLPVPSGQRRAITSTEFLGLKPRSGVTREFIYAKCCSDEFAGQFGSLAIGTSTSHQRVKPENLLAMPSAVPDRKTIARFTKLVSPMLTVCQQLRSQIQNLRRTRDLLLPRLLSGQVSLSEH